MATRRGARFGLPCGVRLGTEVLGYYDSLMRIAVDITRPEPLGGLTPADPARLSDTGNLVARFFEPFYDGSQPVRTACFFWLASSAILNLIYEKEKPR